MHTPRPKKSLGQHFLHDKNILRKIAAAIAPLEDETLVEIGPGTGALTELLAGHSRLVAVEIDGRVIDDLRRRFDGRAEILHSDIRHVDLGVIGGSSRVRIAGNIPYNITSDILFWVFEHRQHIADATLLMQTEVAQRLVAEPRTKQYGILSVCSQIYAEPRRLFNVARTCFSPAPDVDSSVVQLTLRPGPSDAIDGLFRRLVRGLFGKRRKTIRNGLRYMGYGQEAFERVPHVLDLRPEALEPEAFIGLAELLTGVPLADETGTTPASS